jgi:hypothetical protein
MCWTFVHWRRHGDVEKNEDDDQENVVVPYGLHE